MCRAEELDLEHVLVFTKTEIYILLIHLYRGIPICLPCLKDKTKIRQSLGLQYSKQSTGIRASKQTITHE